MHPATRSRLGADMPAFLERLGRLKSTPGRTDDAVFNRISTDIVDWYNYVNQDADGFYRDLMQASGGRPGWGAVGACKLVVELGPSGFDQDPRWHALAELGLTFLRQRRIHKAMLTGYESTYWYKHHPNEDWFEPITVPDRATAALPQVPVGGEYLLAQNGPGGNRNKIILCQRPDDQYDVMIEGPYSDEDPTITRTDTPWYTSKDVYGLLAQIGGTFWDAPAYVCPELKPFMLPPPDYS